MPDTEIDTLTDILDTEAEEAVEVASAVSAPDEVAEQAWPLAPRQALAVVPGRTVVRVPAPALRRVAAGLIDRLLPLPFLSAVFWPWALVVLAYDLLRDAQGASVGKRLLGLETVMVSPDPALNGRPCNAGRSLLRNLLWAGARLCYLSVLLVPVGLALDIIAVLLVSLSPGAGHLGDRIGGTRVVVAEAAGRGF